MVYCVDIPTQDAHHRLQNAHAAQAAFIQKFQTDKAKVDAYKSTIAAQEKVIRKLENIVEAKLQDICRQHASDVKRASDEIGRVKADGARAVDSLQAELESRNSELHAQAVRLREAQADSEAQLRAHQAGLRDAEVTSSCASTCLSTSSPGQVAEEAARSAALLASSEGKIRALEEQLVASSTEAGREIARLNLKIYELEMLRDDDAPSERAPDIDLPMHW